MNVKTQKFLSHAATGFVGTLLVGAVIKLERKVDEKLDERIDSKNASE